MKLWLISQTEVDDYDTYDSAVVAAETEEEARNTHPYVATSYASAGEVAWKSGEPSYDWANLPESVKVRYLGEAVEGMPAGVICASFNAG